MVECPCGSVFPYTDCCAPLIRGVSFADTAEDLMRSRYTAFTQQNWLYLRDTCHPDDRPELKELESGGGVRWRRLEILESRGGGRNDSEGTVRFQAFFEKDGAEKVLRENSKFLKEGGRWYYSRKHSSVEPERKEAPAAASGKPFVREQAKVGRNDPCPCGSGKKFKKCCGK